MTSTAASKLAKPPAVIGRIPAPMVAGVWMIDRRPLAQAFFASRDRLLRYLRVRGGGDDAEDLLQELWLKVDGDLDVTLVEPTSYLFRMAHNLMLDRLRAARRRQERELAFHQGDDDIDRTSNPLRSLLARERLRDVAATLAALGPRTDEVFRLHRIEGMTQVRIAGQLGISLSAVEKHLQKAYRALAGLQQQEAALLLATAAEDGR